MCILQRGATRGVCGHPFNTGCLPLNDSDNPGVNHVSHRKGRAVCVTPSTPEWQWQSRGKVPILREGCVYRAGSTGMPVCHPPGSCSRPRRRGGYFLGEVSLWVSALYRHKAITHGKVCARLSFWRVWCQSHTIQCVSHSVYLTVCISQCISHSVYLVYLFGTVQKVIWRTCSLAECRWNRADDGHHIRPLAAVTSSSVRRRRRRRRRQLHAAVSDTWGGRHRRM
jgi:hypothetical protein